MELPLFEVVGNPIAPDINGPYMPLAKKEIREKFLQYGFTQAALDDVMERYYKDWPIKWYLSGEGLRRAQGVFIKQQAVPFSYFEELIRQKIQIQEVGRMLVHDLQIEATDRLRLMCNIPYGR
jgi:hypothetical protein